MKLILCCLFFIFSSTLRAEENTKIKTAVVNVFEAVVYSDPTLTAPIGVVSRGNTISIGKPLIKSPEVIPVIVSGRVAYIKLSDLYINDETKMATHDPNIMFEKPPENFFENNSATFTIHQQSLGTDFSDLVSYTDGVQKSQTIGLGASFYHNQSLSKIYWGLGAEYYFFSTDTINLGFMMLRPTVGYKMIDTSVYLIDGFVSLDFSPLTTYNIKSNYTNETIDLIYGTTLGARLTLFRSLKYNLISSLSYRYYKIRGASGYLDANDNPIPDVYSLSGFNFSLGFTFNI